MQTRPGSTVPSMKYVLALVALFLVRITFTSGQQDSQFSGVSPFPAGNNTYTNGTLAPYFHNVTATYTWILPRGKYDIGAGSMMCECFDPADGCCMPASKSIAPFCVAGNATCCGDTYCIAGETCCGGACCPSSTSCVITDSVPGCCPAITTCAGPPSCLDATSSACLNEAAPPANCCPQSLPSCGPFAGGGQACYATMLPSSTSATSTELATKTVTVQGTLDVLSEKSASTDYTYFLPPGGDGASISKFSNVIEVFTTVWAIDVLNSLQTVTQLPTTTITVKGTFTVPRAQSPPPRYSLWRPELSEPVSTFSDVVAVYTTIWAIDVASAPKIDSSSAHAASKNSTSTPTSSSTASASYTGGGLCDPSPCEPGPTNGIIATTTSTSVLCFNAVLQRDMPCPTTSTSTASTFDYIPAGASKVGVSGASGSKEGMSRASMLAILASLMRIIADLEGWGPDAGFLGV